MRNTAIVVLTRPAPPGRRGWRPLLYSLRPLAELVPALSAASRAVNSPAVQAWQDLQQQISGGALDFEAPHAGAEGQSDKTTPALPQTAVAANLKPDAASALGEQISRSALWQTLASLTLAQQGAVLQHLQVQQPEPDRQLDVAGALQWLTLQYNQRCRFPQNFYAVGFKWFWRPSLRQFLAGCRLHQVRQLNKVPSGAATVIWGRQVQRPAGPLVQLEDGFLRSVGLGSQFTRPVSWVADYRGLYFDATRPSDLEHFLQHSQFNPAQEQRAERLRQQLCQAKLSKYNVGQGQWQRPDTARRVILVVGQVEQDASIRYGHTRVHTNLGLLQAVREAHPRAYIVYKPHPDVEAGAREAGQGESQCAHYCDEVIRGANITGLIEQVDAVHVLTSLTGFEALLRHKPVTCYGLPFYAGWGLTHDVAIPHDHPVHQRRRPLKLTQLIYGALIAYPLYVSRHTGYFTTPEQVIHQLEQWRRQPSQWRQHVKKWIRVGLNYWSGRGVP